MLKLVFFFRLFGRQGGAGSKFRDLQQKTWGSGKTDCRDVDIDLIDDRTLVCSCYIKKSPPQPREAWKYMKNGIKGV